MFRLFASSVLCLVVLATGCSQVPSQPKPVPVTLKVVLANGESLKSGEVRLSPERGSGGKEVEAVCRPVGDGSFKVTTFAEGDGAVPGRYVVVVKGVRGIADKYTDAETSDLRATIDSSGGTVEVRVAR